MAEHHPDELDLLDLVEGELPRAVEGSVAAHVEGCPACAGTVRQLRAGRSALHASGILELSERRRDAISEAIDGEPRLRSHRFRHLQPRRLGVVLAATLVLVASVLAVAQWAGDPGRDEVGGDAAPSAAETAGGEEGAAEERQADATAPLAGEEPARVAGPAREVATDLRALGLDARVEDAEVVVRLPGDAPAGEEEERLRAYLAERPPGRVVVRVEP